MTARIAIGFGATSWARVEDVVRLIEATLAAHPSLARDPSSSHPSRAVIATLDRRAALAHEVGDALHYAVVTFDAAALAGIAVGVTASPRALASVGSASVAEAAALAALGRHGRLVAARTTGRNCTCAIARMA